MKPMLNYCRLWHQSVYIYTIVPHDGAWRGLEFVGSKARCDNPRMLCEVACGVRGSLRPG